MRTTTELSNPRRKIHGANLKLSQVVERVIDLARIIRNYWETELPKRHSSYPVMKTGEQPVPPPPEEKKLAKLLASLPEHTTYQIGLLMDLGRGYLDVGELSEHYKILKENFENAAALASQLSEHASLGEYLQEGLAELKKRNIDVDELPLKQSKVFK